MTRQIAVRLPEDLVAFIDAVVAHGDAASRAAVVAHAVEQQRRRAVAARDAAILARSEPDDDLDDLDDLARFATLTRLDDLA